MNSLREHFVHHRTYMLGCLGGALLSVVGGVVQVPILEVSGAVICAGFCLQMIRMMAFKPKEAKATQGGAKAPHGTKAPGCSPGPVFRNDA